MAYKCIKCGHIFEAGEQATWKEDYGEEWSGCPLCLGEYEETSRCYCCGSDQFEDELYWGLCLDCIRGGVDYNTFLDYLEANDLLADFMFWYYQSEKPEMVSDQFKTVLRELYLRARADDFLHDKREFLDKCVDYVLNANGDIGKADFAEWLTNHRKGVK